jgi:glyoxylate/hydroxypyruvate reductase A
VKEGADLWTSTTHDAGVGDSTLRVKILLQLPRERIAEWHAPLEAALPDATIALWPDAPANPDYALVWKPPAELFIRARPTRAIFNLGAGVDGLMGVPTLPDNCP